MLAEEVQGLVPGSGILELSIGGWWDARRDHKVALAGHIHHLSVVLLPVRHASVNLPIPVVNLELTSVHELVLSRVRRRNGLLLSILLEHVRLASTVIILAVGT